MNLIPFDQFELLSPDRPEALGQRLARNGHPQSLNAILRNKNKLFHGRTDEMGFKI